MFLEAIHASMILHCLCLKFVSILGPSWFSVFVCVRCNIFVIALFIGSLEQIPKETYVIPVGKSSSTNQAFQILILQKR